MNENILLFTAGVLLIAAIIFGIYWRINYLKIKELSKALKEKTADAKRSASSLNHLNRDISFLNKKLEDENKLKNKFLSIISHDLRQPLVNTKSILELLNSNLISHEESLKFLSQLETQYIQSLNLLDNLLYWIRGQMKGLKITKTDINLFELINGVIEEQQSGIQLKNITVKNFIYPQAEIKAEKEIMKIVFRNLLLNAVKFTPVEGAVNISAVSLDKFIYISVKDSGTGISKEALEKINKHQYFSTEGTLSEKGTGFGLMLVKDLIAIHKGELLIESEEGKGSIFTVKLPLEN